MTAPQSILDLVDRFAYNADAYRNPQYNETQLRNEFLDPFFTALGWDVNNAQGYAEAYKDVVHEDAIKIGGVSKAPDYAFRIGGTRKFFVEAKKPSVNLKDDPKPAFQLRRYAWSAKLPLSVLTDFEEFAVYDCRIQPDESDKPALARTLYIPYTDYATRWHEIEAVFSRNAILKGAFDKYAVDNKSRRGTAEVDAAFLKEIETWRDSLAKNIALRNSHLKNRELNFATQIILDRIIFLRICEDRGIDIYGRLQSLLNGKDVYARLLTLFREADERYNSGLFHFRLEKGRDDQGLDTITPGLSVDDKTLKDILTTLYYPCPYEFSVLPADILGQVYEQFLGKVIRLDARHRAIVEDKPEVKKAGGVYYTPTYIVEYIVEQTAGKLLQGKTPKQAEKLRILDSACGSGSFLIGAYQRLLDWHQQWYEQDGAAKHARGKDAKLYQGAGGAWRLTTGERRRILLANIYGVDIDTQAVEVTKLSLLLKMLEGETQQTVDSTLALFHERVLPDLDANIQCGNSLIGPDFYDGKQLTLLDEEEMYRVNVFDWKKAFSSILTGDNPGFDAVIGNPPYIQSRSGMVVDDDKAYYEKHFKTVQYQVNTYGLFLEKGMNLLKDTGLLGLIVPNYWLSTTFDEKLKQFLFHENRVLELANVYRVFANATVDTLLVTAEKANEPVYPKECRIKALDRKFKSIGERLSAVQGNQWTYQQTYSVPSIDAPINLSFVQSISLSGGRQLGDYFTFKFGMKPYQVGKGTPPQTANVLNAKSFNATTKVDESYLPLLKARNIKRFNLRWQGDWIKYGSHLAEPRTIDMFQGQRILLQRIVSGKNVEATFTDGKFVCNTDVITLSPVSAPEHPNVLFFLGVLASSTAASYIKSQNVNLDRAAFPKINTNTLAVFPIPEIDLKNTIDKARHDRMVGLVEQMLHLHRQLADAAPTTRTTLLRQIEIIDRQIDALVYELYGLTPDEIALVENAG